MSKAPSWPSQLWRAFRRDASQAFRGIAKGVLKGLLQLIGFGPKKVSRDLPPGSYVARDKYGRKELRVPVRSMSEAKRWL